MEPATTQVWAEMLSDRKFLTAPAGAAAPAPGPGPGRGGFGFGPPAAMEESVLPEAPRRLTVPASSVSVFEIEVR